MKTNLTNPITSLSRWTLFLGAMLVLTLMTLDAALAQSSPAPVDLGTAGNFVALAKTGISATGTTSIVGDLGISPAAATAITGFDLIMDPSGTFSTSALVTGKIYAADYTAPTPTMLTVAVGDMETAYTDAAGRPNPDYTELYSGDLTGQTLTRGLYKWGTGVLISAGGVTISGTASDVWIFQIAQGLTLANGAIITLQGGAQASNIFWQVAGIVTLGTSSDFKGIVLCQTSIVMQTGAAFDGKALAQTDVTLDATNVVPVELTSFTATSNGKEVILNWSTATELNNQLFEVQRSFEGNDFATIGFVYGKGTTTERQEYSYSDKNLTDGKYFYRLKQIDYLGSYEYSEVLEVDYRTFKSYLLEQNYPNPFNPATTIGFGIKEKSFVKVIILNSIGEEVAVVVNEEMESGFHTAEFNAANLPSGVYFYQLKAGEFTSMKKMILLK
jgi:Ice-binding-like/Secretion system C-terminal sorting domain